MTDIIGGLMTVVFYLLATGLVFFFYSVVYVLIRTFPLAITEKEDGHPLLGLLVTALIAWCITGAFWAQTGAQGGAVFFSPQSYGWAVLEGLLLAAPSFLVWSFLEIKTKGKHRFFTLNF